MTLLDRLDSFLRDETSIVGQSVARPPLGSRAQEYLGRSVANELAQIWSLDYIGEYRLSQTFNDPIDAVLDLLLAEKDRMVRCGEFPSNQNTDDLYIDFIKLDHGTDVGIYIGFPDKSTKWYAYCLRMQRGGRMGSSVDSSRRITVWRMGESRQLRRERYDSEVSNGGASSSKLRKDRKYLLDLTAFKDAEVSSMIGGFTQRSSMRKANEERLWYDAVRRMISSTLSGSPCFGVENLAESQVGYY